MSVRIVERDSIQEIRKRLADAASITAKKLKESVLLEMDFLKELRFTPVGAHPLEDRPLNLIEQLNQTFTMLTSLRAAELLFDWHPSLRQLRLNLGTSPGTDVESLDDTCAAETFAAVRPQNNDKLRDDVKRVLERTDCRHLYVFFHSPGFEERRWPDLEVSPRVQVHAVEI